MLPREITTLAGSVSAAGKRWWMIIKMINTLEKSSTHPRPNGLLPFCFLTIFDIFSEKTRSPGNEVG